MNSGNRPEYLDFDGSPRIESYAEGPLAFATQSFTPSGSIRIRRLANEYPKHLDLILEWWDGLRWLHIGDTNEMSNDYAYTYIKELAHQLAVKATAYEAEHELPPPPKI